MCLLHVYDTVTKKTQVSVQHFQPQQPGTARTAMLQYIVGVCVQNVVWNAKNVNWNGW